jgi:mRNA-degrading endonuclease RelE of RelBE toxin-antitoxin system
MSGSNHYSLEETRKFKRSLKKLATPALKQPLAHYLKELTLNPEHPKSRREPQPGGYAIPTDWVFYKLRFQISKGASGQIRLMYLVNESSKRIRLLWIYNHDQFAKRPAERDLVNLIQSELEDT